MSFKSINFPNFRTTVSVWNGFLYAEWRLPTEPYWYIHVWILCLFTYCGHQAPSPTRRSCDHTIHRRHKGPELPSCLRLLGVLLPLLHLSQFFEAIYQVDETRVSPEHFIQCSRGALSPSLECR